MSPAGPSDGSQAGVPTQRVAVCGLGPVRFAVPASQVLELHTAPDDLTALPRRGGALRGAFALRDQVVPVVELRGWLPWPGSTNPDQVPALLLVLRQDARCVAIGIDRVEGLFSATSRGLQRLDHGNATDELFSSVVQIADGVNSSRASAAPLGLLDVAGLLRLSRVWAQAVDEPPGLQAAASACPDGEGSAVGVRCAGSSDNAPQLQACAILAYGTRILAIPAHSLRAVVAMPRLQALWHGDPCRLGLGRWRERDVPVRTPQPRRGPTADLPPLLAIVEHDKACVGIAVDQVKALERLDIATIQVAAQAADGPGATPQTRGLSDVICLPGGEPAVWVDVASLVADEPLATLGMVQAQAQTQARLAQASDCIAPLPAHVVVQAGQPWAVPITALQEITEPPAEWLSGTEQMPVPAWHRWREQLMPLLDLRALLGQGATPARSTAKVLIMRRGESLVGVVVESLLHLVPASRLQRLQLCHRDGRPQPCVLQLDGETRRSFAVLQLDRLATGLAGPNRS